MSTFASGCLASHSVLSTLYTTLYALVSFGDAETGACLTLQLILKYPSLREFVVKEDFIHVGAGMLGINFV